MAPVGEVSWGVKDGCQSPGGWIAGKPGGKVSGLALLSAPEGRFLVRCLAGKVMHWSSESPAE